MLAPSNITIADIVLTYGVQGAVSGDMLAPSNITIADIVLTYGVQGAGSGDMLAPTKITIADIVLTYVERRGGGYVSSRGNIPAHPQYILDFSSPSLHTLLAISLAVVTYRAGL